MNKVVAIAFIDFLTALVVFAFGLLYVQMQATKQAEGNTISKAEFVATLDWENGSNSDVDVWLESPTGDVLFFRQKDIGLMSLDRDETGTSHDLISDASGKMVTDPNRHEVATIRAIIPGRFIVNTMLYALSDPAPVHATIRVVKLNPYSVVFEKKIDLSVVGTQVTAGSFVVAPDGSVITTDVSTPFFIKMPERK